MLNYCMLVFLLRRVKERKRVNMPPVVQWTEITPGKNVYNRWCKLISHSGLLGPTEGLGCSMIRYIISVSYPNNAFAVVGI